MDAKYGRLERYESFSQEPRLRSRESLAFRFSNLLQSAEFGSVQTSTTAVIPELVVVTLRTLGRIRNKRRTALPAFEDIPKF
ncbi:hypothetical protein A4G99_15045 [Haladaptatus sp. R4]|nr:hypothetical protein A4G99_15045 [Haladaptatus sp. R4]